MMRVAASIVVLLAGCAARYRTEHVGIAAVTQDAASISLPRGTYQLAVRVDAPRAQVVLWTLRCPGAERTGSIGETFESYRTRRLAELQRMMEQDRRRLATVTNAVVGQVGARMQVQAPGGSVEAEANAPGGDAVAAAAIQPITELPAGDVGAGAYTTTVNLVTFEDGACALTVRGEDALAGSLAATRIRDLKAEAQERRLALQRGAIDTRARLRLRLVAAGADEGARARRIAEEERRRADEQQRADEARRAAEEARRFADAETRQHEEAGRAVREEQERAEQIRVRHQIRLRLDAEARARWEAEAPLRAERARLEQQRVRATRVRGDLVAWLISIGAEPGLRARLALEAELARKRRLEADLRLRLDMEARLEQQRVRAAQLRVDLVSWLISIGGDPHRRARLERERRERAHHLALEADAERARRERSRIELVEQRRHAAITVRAQLSSYLVGAGGRLRPPRPAPIVEVAGTAPFDGAVWVAGSWTWGSGTWTWRKGGWTDSTRFGEAGGEVVVRVPTRVVSPPPAIVVTTPASAPAPIAGVTVAPVPQPASATISTEVVVPLPTIVLPAGATITPRRPARRAPTVRDHRRR